MPADREREKERKRKNKRKRKRVRDRSGGEQDQYDWKDRVKNTVRERKEGQMESALQSLVSRKLWV